MGLSLQTSLNSVFSWVIRGSIMAGILIVLVLVLQFLLRNKLEVRWKYLLWIPVALRVLLPWAPESSLSLYNFISLESIMPGTERQIANPSTWHEWWRGLGSYRDGHSERTLTLEESTVRVRVEGESDPLEPGAVQSKWWNEMKSISLTNGLTLVWLAGVLLLAAKTVYDQRRLRQALRRSRSIETPLLSAVFHETKQLMGVNRNVQFVASERIPGPAVVGFRKPVVVISPRLLITLKKDQLQYILGHEFAHIRRWDVAVNWIMHIILIFHWFNPLVWLAVHRVRQDQEMACDAYALNRMRPQYNSAYGQTIIHVLEHIAGQHQQPGIARMSGTHKQIKRRLIMIKQFNKKSYRLSILGMTIILALGCVTLVNAKGNDAGSTPQALTAQTEDVDIKYPEESMGSKVDRELHKKEMDKAMKKAAEAAKALTTEEKTYIENEISRVKELVKETGDTYVIYHKYKDLNSGLDLSFWGSFHEFTSYEDYMTKASALEGSYMQQPANLPTGYTFTKAIIGGPTEGKFIDDLRVEAKKSGKPVYVKKMDWKEAATIRLKYTNGEDTLTLSKYTVDADGSKNKGFFNDDLPAHIFPKYVFWHDGGKFGYSISTSSNISMKQKIEILKAAVKPAEPFIKL
ncbi:M56 family metallopeptidase [Paenibacillus sp. GCM10012306]|uniref:M56 family metallopeptidase n=1 Tax=Paenibacillus sp. GCM10012306 TaxID=3317342 RepID=UPI0036163DE0